VRIAYGGTAQSLLLISGGVSQEVKFWRLPPSWQGPGGFLKRGQPGHEDWITAVAAAADGRLAATAARDHQIYLWELSSGQLRRSLPISALPKSMAFDPTGQWLAVACANQTVCLFAVYGQGEKPQTVLQLAEAAHCITYSPDGRWLTAVGDKNSLWVYDFQTQTATNLTAPGGAPTSALNSVRFAKDGWGLAAGGDDGIVHNFVAYHPDSKAPLPPERWLHLGVANRQNGVIRALALTADGNYVVSGGDDKQLYWWDVAHQRQIGALPLPEPIFDLSLGPTWQTVIVATNQGKIGLFWVNVT
jgi:WD40 repeat protein